MAEAVEAVEELTTIEYAVHGSGTVTTRPLRMPQGLGRTGSLFVGFEGHSLRCEVLLAAPDSPRSLLHSEHSPVGKAILPFTMKNSVPVVRPPPPLAGHKPGTEAGWPAGLCDGRGRPAGPAVVAADGRDPGARALGAGRQGRRAAVRAAKRDAAGAAAAYAYGCVPAAAPAGRSQLCGRRRRWRSGRSRPGRR